MKAMPLVLVSALSFGCASTTNNLTQSGSRFEGSVSTLPNIAAGCVMRNALADNHNMTTIKDIGVASYEVTVRATEPTWMVQSVWQFSPSPRGASYTAWVAPDSPNNQQSHVARKRSGC